MYFFIICLSSSIIFISFKGTNRKSLHLCTDFTTFMYRFHYKSVTFSLHLCNLLFYKYLIFLYLAFQ
nr:MAG TPA: hypothetical protein [Bacteriophage sp.]DAU40831.1 MAG TPA: hypothetical protein [Caudoviricetes sp.]